LKNIHLNYYFAEYVIFLPNDKLFMLWCSHNIILIYSMINYKCISIKELKIKKFDLLKFSNDGKYLAVIGP